MSGDAASNARTRSAAPGPCAHAAHPRGRRGPDRDRSFQWALLVDEVEQVDATAELAAGVHEDHSLTADDLGRSRPAETRSDRLGAGDRFLRVLEIARVDRPEGIHRRELKGLHHPAGGHGEHSVPLDRRCCRARRPGNEVVDHRRQQRVPEIVRGSRRREHPTTQTSRHRRWVDVEQTLPRPPQDLRAVVGIDDAGQLLEGAPRVVLCSRRRPGLEHAAGPARVDTCPEHDLICGKSVRHRSEPVLEIAPEARGIPGHV